MKNTISNAPKLARAKFVGSDRLFCFVRISKFGSSQNNFAMITNLSELYFRRRRFLLLVKAKEVFSLSYGSSTNT